MQNKRLPQARNAHFIAKEQKRLGLPSKSKTLEAIISSTNQQFTGGSNYGDTGLRNRRRMAILDPRKNKLVIAESVRCYANERNAVEAAKLIAKGKLKVVVK